MSRLTKRPLHQVGNPLLYDSYRDFSNTALFSFLGRQAALQRLIFVRSVFAHNDERGRVDGSLRDQAVGCRDAEQAGDKGGDTE